MSSYRHSSELSIDVWKWTEVNQRYGRTITIKIKWADFEQSTRSRTIDVPITELSEFRAVAADIVESMFPIPKGIRLIGIGMSGFTVPAQDVKETQQLQLNLEA